MVYSNESMTDKNRVELTILSRAAGGSFLWGIQEKNTLRALSP